MLTRNPRITAAGLALFTEQEPGFSVAITDVALGTGVYDPTGAETALQGEFARFPISSGTIITPSQIQIGALVTNTDATARPTSNQYVGELGFYVGETLFAVLSQAGSALFYKSPGLDVPISYILDFSTLPPGSLTIEVPEISESLVLAAETANAAAISAQAALATISASYYGAFAVAPATRPDGSARQAGDRYFDTVASAEKTWNGAAWYIPNIDSAALALPDGAGLVGFQSDIPGAAPTTVEEALNSLGVRAALNALWAGEFRCWPMGHALNVETTQRTHIPAGVTQARLNYTSGVTISHVEGTHLEDAMRIQRVAGNASEDSHSSVANLTREETKILAGKRCTLQFNGWKSATYSGGNLAYRVQYSTEPEQPILNADGTYTSGNVNLLSGTVALGVTAQPEDAPFCLAFDLPAEAVQVAVVLVAPFAGVAGADDYVAIEGLSVHRGNWLANILREAFASLMLKARTRYQSSYPYGAPRGTNTEQGSVSAVGINTAVNWALALNIRFDPPMAVIPQFIFQSPTSGTESRLLNKDAALNINGLAFALSDNGVIITNNAAGVAGNRYLCHWVANIIF